MYGKKAGTIFLAVLLTLGSLNIRAQDISKSVKSSKRGLAYGYFSEADLRAIAPGISWWYNWYYKPEAGAASIYQASQVEFVPMIWGGQPNSTAIAGNINLDAHYLMGFNEPNFISEANKKPSEAAALWPALEEIAKQKNLKIVSPALNYCDECVSENGVNYTDPIAYLDDFFEQCNPCQVDYIAVHSFVCDVNALKSYINKFKKYNKPIWLTEFSCGDIPHDQISLEKQKEYMKAAVSYLEEDPDIFRYAWFSGRNNKIPFVNLLAGNGELTELGKLYISLAAKTIAPSSNTLSSNLTSSDPVSSSSTLPTTGNLSSSEAANLIAKAEETINQAKDFLLKTGTASGSAAKTDPVNPPIVKGGPITTTSIPSAKNNTDNTNDSAQKTKPVAVFSTTNTNSVIGQLNAPKPLNTTALTQQIQEIINDIKAIIQRINNWFSQLTGSSTPPQTTSSSSSGNSTSSSSTSSTTSSSGSTTSGSSSSSSSSTSSTSGTTSSSGNVQPTIPTDQSNATEVIQYRMADGTLVTRMGMRSTERHAREPWDNKENKTGIYFTYPAMYFQNRSFGLEIHDHIPAGEKSIEFFLVVNNGTFDGTTFSLFRNLENATAYGWNLNTGFNNPTLNNQPICIAGQPLANCKIVVDSNWRTDPHSPLKIGDRIELAPAPRLQRTEPGGKSLIDGGGSRYYSFEQLYIVGVGVKPWYGVEPRLDSAPLPDSTLLGGDTTVSYNYSSEALHSFQQMVNNIGITNTQSFLEGRRVFHSSFKDGRHSEHTNDNLVFSGAAGRLGPQFNQERCAGCHVADGRSPGIEIGKKLDTLSVLTGSPSPTHERIPDQNYGLVIQQNSAAAGGQDHGVMIEKYETTTRTLSGGELVELHKPIYKFTGPVPAQFSVRQAPQLIGVGLLEAIPEQDILAQVDTTDKNNDGVKGIANYVKNPESGKLELGRFGWKASKISIRHQSADALMTDMGVVSRVFATRDCLKSVTNCYSTTTIAGISDHDLQRLVQYLQLLGVPAQRSIRSAYPAGVTVPDIHNIDPVRIESGRQQFSTIGCASCHTTQFKTGNSHVLAELRNQTIHPYTDLLLHDMGAGLADNLDENPTATANRWRTPPLWGLGLIPYVYQGNQIQGGTIIKKEIPHYLHDGRATTLSEAILWHDGEARRSRLLFEGLSKQDRDNLLLFLNSL